MQDPQDESERRAGGARRPKRGAEHWRGVIEKLDASGLSVAEFCAAEGVAIPSVYHWRRKLRDDADAVPARVVRLEAASVSGLAEPATAATRGLAVAELVGGDRVSVDAAELPRLIAALRTPVPDATR